MTLSLHHILKNVWNICFPPSKEEDLVASLSSIDIKKLFLLGYTDGVWRLSSFQNPQMRALIHEAKFHRNGKAHETLADLLGLFIGEKKSLTTALWFPIPLSKARLRERGYNQVYEVLCRLPSELNVQLRTDCLMRTRDTKPQTELPRGERFKNVVDAFTCTQPDLIAGKDIVILDDVTTTGATLRAAEAALLPYNPNSVTLVALSH